MQQMGGSFRQGGGTPDSLRQRNKQEDSITIHFRYLDSVGIYLLDSSVRDFTRRFPLPPTWINLGNTGSAARSLLFAPAMQAGFRNGFNAFDVYNWNMENVRFFQTTRPYSEINYLLGSRVEQIIDLLHTQNLKPNWNASFGYRMINSPGFFKNQKVNHNNYQFTSSYESVNRRYRNQLVLHECVLGIQRVWRAYSVRKSFLAWRRYRRTGAGPDPPPPVWGSVSPPQTPDAQVMQGRE